MDWALLLLGAAAGYAIRWGQKELNAERFWILPYREQCRRYVGTRPGSISEEVARLAASGFVSFRCQNRAWRIRWHALSPLSVVCRSCRKADAKGRVGA